MKLGALQKKPYKGVMCLLKDSFKVSKLNKIQGLMCLFILKLCLFFLNGAKSLYPKVQKLLLSSSAAGASCGFFWTALLNMESMVPI